MADKIPKLGASGLDLAEYNHNRWSISVPEGITPEDVLRPEYWAHVVRKLHIADRIEVLAEDNAFYMELLVLSVGLLRAVVTPLIVRDFRIELADVEEEELPHEFEVKWGGNTDKHRVIRLADNVVVHRGSASKEEALTWLREYRKTLVK